MQAALDKLQFFLQVFPDIKTLAHASEEQVLQAFSGLGYYNRARNLHKAAKYIFKNYGNENFPSTYAELQAVVGIGDYTASAILSIAFNQPVLAIDANVIRIYQRMNLQHLSSPVNKTQTKEIQKFFEPFFLPPAKKNKTHHNGDINEALMQLGQKVCVLKNPLCNTCPLASCCLLFLEKEDWEKFPRKKKKQEKIITQWQIFLLYTNVANDTNDTDKTNDTSSTIASNGEDNTTSQKTDEIQKVGKKRSIVPKKSKQKILIKQLNDFYFLNGHYGFAGCITFLNKNLKNNSVKTYRQTTDPLACLLENFLKTSDTASEITQNTFRHAITNHNITVKTYEIYLENLEEKTQAKIQKIIQEEKSYKLVSIYEVKKYLSASVFLKALIKSAQRGT